jgi:hypothetical protein
MNGNYIMKKIFVTKNILCEYKHEQFTVIEGMSEYALSTGNS